MITALSRSTRRQLIALDLIEGLVDAARAENPSDTRVDQITRRITRQQQNLRSSLITTGQRGQMIFPSTKEYRRYARELDQVQNAILSQWPKEELDGREYVNALLSYCDRLRIGKLAGEWETMTGMLQELYEELDPGLEAESCMEVGESAGEKLREAMEG